MGFNSKLATFSFFVFVVGMILTYLTYSQHAKLSNKCVSKQVQTGMNVLLVLSTMMMVIPLVQLACHWGCSCPQNDLWYKWIVVSICIMMVITGSIVLNGLKGDCDTKSVKDFMIGLITTGSIIVFILVVLPLVIPSLRGLFDEGFGSDDYYYPTAGSATGGDNLPASIEWE